MNCPHSAAFQATKSIWSKVWAADSGGIRCDARDNTVHVLGKKHDNSYHQMCKTRIIPFYHLSLTIISSYHPQLPVAYCGQLHILILFVGKLPTLSNSSAGWTNNRGTDSTLSTNSFKSAIVKLLKIYSWRFYRFQHKLWQLSD